MPFALHNMRRCRITGNRLDVGRNGWYAIWSAVETVFENNLIQARDLEGTYGGVQGKTYRTYFAGNTFRDAYGNEREALTFDSPYNAKWMGRAGGVAGNVLTGQEYSGAPTNWTPGALKGLACYVAAGKGLGQYLPIADNSATTLTLERPWAVPPDATSHLAVIVMKTDTVVTGQHIRRRERGGATLLPVLWFHHRRQPVRAHRRDLRPRLGPLGERPAENGPLLGVLLQPVPQ